jgi:lipoprotein-anchoring transpeptidase ErfK/SrfK
MEVDVRRRYARRNPSGARTTRAALAVAASLACLLAAGCGGRQPTAQSVAETHWNEAEPPAEVAITPAADATKVSPTAVVTVKATAGTLDSVDVRSSSGKALKGAISDDKLTWQSTEKLGYARTYTVTVHALNAKGVEAQAKSTFKTIKPGNFTLPYLSPTGGTFGIGQPVVVRFDEPIPNRKTAEKSIKITTTPAVAGRFHWFNDHEVHWRPEKYWAPGTKVEVKASVYGVNFGSGLWGQEDRATSFTIGESHLAIADNNSHYMKVFVAGKLVRTVPVSMGKGGTTTGSKGEEIDFWTRSGPHVVLDKHPEVRMWSGSYGITDPKDPNFYDEKIKFAVRISDAGEYVHLADWNIWAHGVANTSHGCINVGPANATWFYSIFVPGDVVEVVNSPKQLSPTDGLGDWTIPWNQW